MAGAEAEFLGKVAVVDANGLLDGALQARQDAHEVVTTMDAQNEVTDARGREQLFALKHALEPVGGLQIHSPSSSSAAAVWRFAKHTGDATVLSNTDLGLLAVARSLHMRKHGNHSVRTLPPPLRSQSAQGPSQIAPMPGWDYVPNPDDWPDEDGAASASASTTAAADASEESSASSNVAVDGTKPGHEHCKSPAEGRNSQGMDATSQDMHREQTDNSDWIVKVGRRAAQRRRKQRRQGMLQQECPEDAESSNTTHKSKERDEDEAGVESIASAPPATILQQGFNDATSVEPNKHERLEEGEASTTEVNGDNDMDNVPRHTTTGVCTSSELESTSRIHEQYNERDVDSDFEEVQTPEVWLVTGDFAMQNVAIQMGLGIMAPSSGNLLREARRYTRRCHACGTEARDPKRHFCGQCGNASLIRCAVRATPTGTEYELLAAPKPRLAGTRYSLPKPRGGRINKSNAPVLREDELPLNRRRKNKPNREVPDPFAPEFAQNLFEREGKPRQHGPAPAGRPLVGKEGNPNKPMRPRKER